MASLNRVQILGNLGREAELRSMPDGTRVATLNVATSERWKDKKTGEMQEKTEWHRVVLYGALAEVVESYTKTGSSVLIDGKLRTRKWADKDGVDRYTTEIVGKSLQLLGKKTPEESKADGLAAGASDDEVPF